MTSYETVFKRFENKVEDIKVLKLASDDWTELCLEWLNSAIAMIELDQLKIEHDLTKKNDVLFEFEDTLTNGEIEVVALYMVVAWYDIRLNSLEHTNMFYGSKDEKWTSQKEHANYIMSIQKKYKRKPENILGITLPEVILIWMVIRMKYKYGTFNDNQFSDYIELLHNKIHWLLIYQENSYPKLDNYFNNLQLYIAALAELIPSPYIIDLANTIECAKLEFNNPNFNHQKYRKIIFDAHSIIDKIGDNHE